MEASGQRATKTALDVALADAIVSRVARDGQMLLVGAEPELAEALREAGLACACVTPNEVLAGARERIEAPRPTAVVLVSGWERDAARLIAALVALWPGAELGVVRRNPGSAESLIRAAVGASGDYGMAERTLLDVLAASGLQVRESTALETSRPPGLIAAETEAAMLRLFTQLNAASAATRWLHWAVAADAPRTLEAGLLSVVIRNHSLARLELLDVAIFSLACQEQRPLEIVIASQCTDPDAEPKLRELLELHQPVGGYRFQVVMHASREDIRSKLANEGIRAARGQYVAFLDDDDVVYPNHYAQMVQALASSGAAWAVANARRAYFVPTTDGGLYCQAKRDMPGGESAVELVRENYIPNHAYVIDRLRTGPFPIAYPEGMSRNEDYVFLLRLAGLFPAVHVRGPATCEHRLRSDGTNTLYLKDEAETVQAEKLRAWELAEEVLREARRGIEVLVNADAMRSALERLEARAIASVEPPLRLQVIDRVNSLIKSRLPRVHEGLRAAARRLVR